MKEENSNIRNEYIRDPLSREIFSSLENEASSQPVISPSTAMISAPERRLITVPVVAILVGFLAYIVGYGTITLNPPRDTAEVATESDNSLFLNDATLEARAAYVYDVKNDSVLYAHGGYEVLPLASLTKLMAALVVSETLPKDAVVTITANDIKTEGDTGLRVGERWNLSDIIGFTLMTSSNDGASALASAAGSLGQTMYEIPAEQARADFVNKMNTKAEELGLRGTRFFNGTGLDLNGEISGGYGTARDVALLMAEAVRTMYDDLSITALPQTSISSLANIRHVSTNTNEYVGRIPNLIASKTGYTDLAGGNLVIAFDAGLMRPIIISVLGSSREGRFTDVEKLVWATLESITRE